MTDFMKIVKERRSIRKYEDRDVPEDILNQVLEAVQWSPSWANTQCWDIVVVRDQALKEKLQQTIAPKNPATKAVTNAPVLLVVCGKKESAGYYKDVAVTKFGDWMMFDLGIATQSICLTAQANGLGTVIVGMFFHDKAADILNLPETHEVAVMIPIGYPAKISQAPERRAVDTIVHYDGF